MYTIFKIDAYTAMPTQVSQASTKKQALDWFKSTEKEIIDQRKIKGGWVFEVKYYGQYTILK